MDICVDLGFPGAGRVVRQLSILSGDKIAYNPSPLPEKVGTMFLPAWSLSYPDLIKKVGAEKVVSIWTSTVLQSGFEPVEFEYMKTIVGLLDQGKIHALWVGSGDWLPFLAKSGRKVFFCPYPISLPQWTPRDRSAKRDIGLFGPLPPRKNVAVQAMAAKLEGRRLHITDSTANRLLSDIGVQFVDHGWLDPAKYESTVSLMDLGLQCSLPGAESHSFVCWDFLSRDIPCISTVDWLPQELRVPADEALSPSRVASKIALLQVHKSGYWRSGAERFGQNRNAGVRATLESELGISL